MSTIKFPPDTKKLRQLGNTDLLGNIWSSSGLDLTSNAGRIRVAPRGVVVTNDSDVGSLRTPVAFQFFATDATNQKLWAIAGTHMFYNTGRPDQVWVQDANSGTPAVNATSDMDLFNSALYVVGTTSIKKFNGSAWSEIGSSIGTPETSCCVFAGRFYYVRNASTISSISSADANTNASGNPNSNEFTLNITNYGIGGSNANKIVSIRASSNRIWIATVDASSQNYSAGRNGKVFEWDGVSVQASKVYYLDSIGAMALVIKDDLPYVMDADGKLLKYAGTYFKEVARLPVPPNKFLRNPLNTSLDTFIHPRGITVQNGRIQMLINNEVDDSGATILENLPSGIWEYDEEIGLYHKHSMSIWQLNVTTTRRDYGQNRLSQVGALFNSKSTSNSSALNGSLLVGYSYRADASSQRYAIGVVDSKNTISKVGYVVTTKIDTANVEETWQKIYATHKLLLDSTDKICLKYRTSEIPPVEGSITYTIQSLGSTNVFTTTLNLSSFAIGDEVEITQGGGGGQIEHITAISEAGGTYTVTVANQITGAVFGNNTARARFQKWISLGEQIAQDIDFKEFPIAKSSSWIQLKLVMYFTGEDELNYLQLVSQPHILTSPKPAK